MSSDTLWGILALILFVSVPSILLWAVVQALRTGVLRGGKGGPIARSEFPTGYWFGIGGYLIVFGMWMFFLGRVAFDVWRDGWS